MRLNGLFEDSALAKIILFIIGLGIALAGIINYQLTPHGAVNKIFALFLLLGAGAVFGVICAILLPPLFGEWFGNKVWAPTKKIKRAPERLHYMQGLVEEGKYQEAIVELKNVLIRDFLDIEARMLLWRVYEECLKDTRGAIEISLEYFDHPAHESTGESFDLLMYLSDVLPREKAAVYLKNELKRGEYSNYDRKALENRLEALS